MNKSRKLVSQLPDHPAVNIPVTSIPLPPDMGIVLDCLEESIRIAQRGVEAANNRWRVYIYQCATALHLNAPQYKFDADKRTFVDNPDYVSPQQQAQNLKSDSIKEKEIDNHGERTATGPTGETRSNGKDQRSDAAGPAQGE